MKRRSFLAALSAVPRAPILSSSLPESFGMTRHLFTASTWSYLWDLADERYAQALGRMKDNALTAVGLACAYHAGKFLAAHNPKRKVDVLEDGTVCSTPIPSQYGRIQPRINSLVGQGHSLAVVRREAERSGMETRAWVACCHNTRLGTQYPDIVCRTSHDDPLYHSVCPTNDDVRKYLREVVSDIASQRASVIELEA